MSIYNSNGWTTVCTLTETSRQTNICAQTFRQTNICARNNIYIPSLIQNSRYNLPIA